MARWIPVSSVLAVVGIVCAGCTSILGILGTGASDGTSQVVSDVAAKAVSVAAEVGGANGFGGTLMDGYSDHSPEQMGFQAASDLASSTGAVMMLFHNQTDEDCTFDISYVASHMGLDEQMMQIDVIAGETATVEIPCAEIVGMGSLQMPGSRACLLADGEEIDNRMAVPGFLGLDFECGDTYEHFLMHDLEDLDGDGDMAENIVISEAMDMHRLNGGPTGHAHGDGPSMMGSHMGL